MEHVVMGRKIRITIGILLGFSISMVTLPTIVVFNRISDRGTLEDYMRTISMKMPNLSKEGQGDLARWRGMYFDHI